MPQIVPKNSTGTGLLAGYVSYEEADSRQTGETVNGVTWNGDRDEKALAFGAGGKTHMLEERLELCGDFSWVESVAKLEVDSDRHPDLTARVKRFDLYASYEVDEDFDVRLRYRLEDYSSDDWATTGEILTAGGNIVTLGQDDTEYRAQSIGPSLAYRL